MKKKRREERKEKLPENGAATTENGQPAESSIVHGDFLSVEGEQPTRADSSLEGLDALDAENTAELEQRLWDDDEPPTEDEIAEENRLMLRRQREFRIAAEYVSAAFAFVPEVVKVVLFGSVALPLKKKVPRFRKFRRAGIAIWHECRDVDIAVCLSDLGCLDTLRRATSRALNDLLREKDIGVAHHQVDVYIMEVGTDRYLGRLCCFNKCPKGKPACDVPGCGATPFLRQYEDFLFNPAVLQPERAVVLFDRDSSGDSGDSGDEIPF